MFVFKLYLLTFLVPFKIIYGSPCDVLPHTFSFTAIQICEIGNKCTNTTIDGCLEHKNATSAKISSHLKVIRRGAFQYSPSLKAIKIDGVGLEEIEPKAFMGLTSPSEISLANNRIGTISGGVFSKTGFRSIDLKSNRISAIDDFAFASMENVLALTLNDNLLEHIKDNWFFNTTVRALRLSDNKLKVIETEVLSNIGGLINLDVSFNRIDTVDVSPKATLNLLFLNLCGNKLSDLDFLSDGIVRVLYMGANKISYLDDSNVNYISDAKVEEIFVHPNPWQCACLSKFENLMRIRKIAVGDPNRDSNIIWKDEYPLCVDDKFKRGGCNGITDSDVENGQEEYFKVMSYDKLKKAKYHINTF